jgi:hypothetical protein
MHAGRYGAGAVVAPNHVRALTAHTQDQTWRDFPDVLTPVTVVANVHMPGPIRRRITADTKYSQRKCFARGIVQVSSGVAAGLRPTRTVHHQCPPCRWVVARDPRIPPTVAAARVILISLPASAEVQP